MLPLLAALVVTLGSAACSGGGGGGSPGTIARPGNDLSGRCSVTIEGTRDGQPFQTDATFDLIQTGDQVEGTWSTTQDPGQSGTISAVIAGISLTFILEQDKPCDGFFTGQATVSAGNTVSGSYTGSSCLGDDDVHFVIGACVPATP